MRKTDLIKQISKNAGLSIEKSRTFLNVFVDIVKESLVEEDNVYIKGVGRLFVKKQKERWYYNIAKKEVCLLPPRNVISFRASSKLIQKEVCDFGVEIHHSPQPYIIKERSILNNSNRTNSTIEKRQSSKKQWKFPANEGNVILPNKPNLGKRFSVKRNESVIFRTVGKVTCGENHLTYSIPNFYHSFFIPQNGTDILGYNIFSGTTGGVTEPILFHTLNNYFEKYPEIDILQNLSIPIKNRNYGYKPDIALIWREKNIYFDIEIDEPYDIISRKPIHYIGCSDELRNKYLQENGWFVIRFSEEQIVNDIEYVRDVLLAILSYYTDDKRFSTELKLNNTNRWSYEEAIEMEKACVRENYLKIEKVLNEPESLQIYEDYVIPEQFDFIKPDLDILTYDKSLEKKLKKSFGHGNYTIVKRNDDGYEFVIMKVFPPEFKWKDNEYGIEFVDSVEMKKYFLPLSQIDSFCNKEEISRIYIGDNFDKFIYDNMIHCHPVHIKYCNNDGFESTRTLLYLTPWMQAYNDPENRNKISDLDLISQCFPWMYKNVIGYSSISYFSAFCLKRCELRTFKSHSIQGASFYDCFKPKAMFGTNLMWELLTEGGAEYVEIIYENMPTTEKTKPFNIGNYCNALVCKGEINKAYKLVKNIPKGKIIPFSSNKSWYELVTGDIDYFIENDIKKENFIKFKEKIERWR
jgi:nucleoid DNA-binding protein